MLMTIGGIGQLKRDMGIGYVRKSIQGKSLKLSQTLIDDIVQQETPKKAKKRQRQELEEAGEDSSLADSRRAEKKQRISTSCSAKNGAR